MRSMPKTPIQANPKLSLAALGLLVVAIIGFVIWWEGRDRADLLAKDTLYSIAELNSRALWRDLPEIDKSGTGLTETSIRQLLNSYFAKNITGPYQISRLSQLDGLPLAPGTVTWQLKYNNPPNNSVVWVTAFDTPNGPRIQDSVVESILATVFAKKFYNPKYMNGRLNSIRGASHDGPLLATLGISGMHLHGQFLPWDQFLSAQKKLLRPGDEKKL